MIGDPPASCRCACGRHDLSDRGFFLSEDGTHSVYGCPGVGYANGGMVFRDPAHEEHLQAQLQAEEYLDANPKDLIGQTKVPLSLVPQTAIAECSLALLEGALKYGRWNWRNRKTPIRVSVYLDACRRHLAKFEAGIEIDPDSGRPHLSHAMATLVILIDAIRCKNFIDDRPPASVDLEAMFEELTPEVKRMVEKYADRNPHHYTIEDR